MAKTTVIADDLDGTAGADTVSFSINGDSWEIDLSKKNRTAMEKALKPYIDAARTAKRPTKSKAPSASRRGPKATVDLGAIRAWAAENGHTVSDRGRIARTVVDAYQAAH